MERLKIQGKFEGTWLRGRSQRRWTDQITKSNGKTIHAFTTEALDRDQWKEVDNEFTVATTVPQGSTDWGEEINEVTPWNRVFLEKFC
jgi:hypothetical protein